MSSIYELSEKLTLLYLEQRKYAEKYGVEKFVKKYKSVNQEMLEALKKDTSQQINY